MKMFLINIVVILSTLIIPNYVIADDEEAPTIVEITEKRAEQDKNINRSIIITAIGSGFTVIFIEGLISNMMKLEVGIWLLALLTVLLEFDNEKED